MLAPCLTVLSSLEGVAVASPETASSVVPLTLVLLSLLSAVQRFGTVRNARNPTHAVFEHLPDAAATQYSERAGHGSGAHHGGVDALHRRRGLAPRHEHARGLPRHLARLRRPVRRSRKATPQFVRRGVGALRVPQVPGQRLWGGAAHAWPRRAVRQRMRGHVYGPSRARTAR